ncbi:MAG: response regulator transcription factor [Candidatus Limivicinus sp.]|jgi:two-component system response regulator RegX3
MTDVLIIEDNEEIGTLLQDFLKSEGFTSVLCGSGREGLEFFKSQGARLVVLDIMLPGMDGFAVCQAIRKEADTPLLIVSARTEKEDKLNGLILGADDYIEKPYDIDLLLAKIHGIFKRRYGDSKIVCGDLTLDKKARRVLKAGTELKITGKEFELLQIFMENPGRTLSKEALFARVWGNDSFSELQTLTVHINWLREKIEKDAKNPVHIVTVWGVGYRFEAAV